MTSFLLFLLKVFVYLNCCIQKSKAISSSLGTKFYFAVPNGMDSPLEYKKILVYLFTLSTKDVQVDLTSPWFDGEQLNIHKTLIRLKIHSIDIPTTHISTQQKGTQFSYKIVGTRKLGVIIFVVANEASADSFTLVPVEGWGKKYVAWTDIYMPSVQVVTDLVNVVEFRLKLNQVTFLYLGKSYRDGDVLTANLRENEAFTLAFCTRTTVNAKITLEGTRINCSEPCGVISGNCLIGRKPLNCVTMQFQQTNTITGDIVAEMLMPLETLGTEFITINVIGRKLQGEVKVITTEPNTRITTTETDGKELYMDIENSWTTSLINWTGIRYFRSDKPLSVMYFMLPACRSAKDLVDEDGDPSMSNIIPTPLFYDNYIWSTPSARAINPKHFVCLVIKTVDKVHLRLDDLEIPEKMQWNNVIGAPYEIGNMQVTSGTHTVYGAQLIKFGCYIYGLAWFYSYMNPGGFITSAINVQCTPSSNNKNPGDLIDNDCDQRIDEEIEDGIDNDNDNRIDEDLAKPPRRNGGWGEWMEWNCVTGCLTYNFRRERLCDNPPPENEGDYCQGNEFDVKGQNERNCGFGKMCPTDCPVGRWHYGCEKSCENCEQDCDKFKGNCTTCKPGFTDAASGCSQSCPQFTFGARCNGNCIAKCMTECVDKISGACPPTPVNNMVYLWWLLLLLPIAIIIVYLLRKQSEIAANAEGEM